MEPRVDSLGRRWLAGAIATAVASGVAFVVLALVVRGGPLPIDLSAAGWLRPLALGPVGVVIDAVNLVGQPFVWDPLVAIAAIVAYQARLPYQS